MHGKDFDALADAIRSASHNVATYNAESIGVTDNQVHLIIATFVDGIGEWLLDYPQTSRAYSVDRFLDACGYPRPARGRRLGGYLDEAVEMYRAGQSVAAIADELGVARRHVLYEFQHAGVRLRHDKRKGDYNNS